MDDKKKPLAPPLWLGRPILSGDHVQDLETRAAVGEFHSKLPRAQAEAEAHGSYVKEQRERSAAHHLAGLRAATAVGNHEDARRHWAMYDLHTKALGKESIGAVPPEIEKRLTEQGADKPVYRFKAHPGDLFAFHEPSKDMAPAQGEPIKKAGDGFDKTRAMVRQMDAADQLHAGKPKFAAGAAVHPHVDAIRNATNADLSGHVGRVVSLSRPNGAGHRYVVDFHGPRGTQRGEFNEQHLLPAESNVTNIHKAEVSDYKCSTCGFVQMPEDRAKDSAGCKNGKPHSWPSIPVKKEEKSAAGHCQWRLGERRCKRLVSGQYCHDHKNHWSLRIKSREEAHQIAKALRGVLLEAARGVLVKAVPAAGTTNLTAPPALHSSVEGFVGGLKTLPKGSPARGKFITQHMNHAPFLAALKTHPQGQAMHAQLTAHLNSAQNAGFKPGATVATAKAELGHIQKPCPLCNEKQKNLSAHLESEHFYEMEGRRKNPDDPVVQGLKGIKKGIGTA